VTDPIVRRLQRVVGPSHVLTGEDTAGHTTDWTGRWHGACSCVVRPGSTAEVAAAVAACADAGVPVVPQGGNTGLVGGAVPRGDAVVLSTARLTRVGPVDERFGRLLVGAGTTLAAVRAAAAAGGWAFGVDLASRDTATIGGMVATDAGGARTVAHGSMRDQVVGLVAVLADGSIVRPWLDGRPAGRDGLDLRAALVGSEGTLGVVTRVLLRLVRPAPTTVSVLLQAGEDELGALVERVRAAVAASPATLTACELMTRDGCRLVADVLGVASPVHRDTALLLDLAGDVDDDLLQELDDAGSGDTVVGLDEQDRERLWALREGHTDAIARLGVPVKLDVRVPVGELGPFLAAVPGTVASVVPAARCVLFGHAAEGNVHVNVVDGAAHARWVEDAVYDLVAALGGSVAAEHGVGRAKLAHLHRTTPDEELDAMRATKAALDPDDVCNPGVRVPSADR
jgi:FAD/FMN-containing dehydrogenase